MLVKPAKILLAAMTVCAKGHRRQIDELECLVCIRADSLSLPLNCFLPFGELQTLWRQHSELVLTSILARQLSAGAHEDVIYWSL